MDKQQLKPCPFCGGEAEIKQYRSDGIRIRCRECSEKIEQRCMRLTLDQLEELMIADWNKRMPQPPSASDERERFNQWSTRAGKYHVSGYNPHEDLWEAWQARAALAPSPGVDAAEHKPVPFRLGNEYQTQAGEWVRFVSVHNEGTSYETMADENGHHRYTQRDFGRLTGTAHDYSEPGNTPPLYAAPSPAANADEWVVEAERLADEAIRAYGDERFQNFAGHVPEVVRDARTASKETRAALFAHLKERS